MEENLKKIICQFDSKIESFLKDLQEKKILLRKILNLYITEINKQSKRINITLENEYEAKKTFKLSEIINQIGNILNKDYNDFIMNAKQIIELFEIIEDNEFYITNNTNYIFKNNNDFQGIRMDKKNAINYSMRRRIVSVCSIKENNNIYNKICVGLSNGKLEIYDLNKGYKLLEIPEAIKNSDIIDICDLKNGIIACTNGYFRISIIKIKEDILLNDKNISVKCSYEVIQNIGPMEKQRYTENKIINIKLNKIKFQIGEYENDYIIQSGWDHLKLYIKKNNNNRYYLFKEIKTSSRTYSLLNFEEKNQFFAFDYFLKKIYVFSSETMELIYIIKGIEGNENVINPFGKVNKRLFVYLGLENFYLYNADNMKLIQEIKFEEPSLYKNVIFGKDNSLFISLYNRDNGETKILEYKYFPKEKKLKRKGERILSLGKCNCLFSNNEKGKKYLIAFNHEGQLCFLK